MNLVTIRQAARPENAALLLNPADNVAVARVPLPAGFKLRMPVGELEVREPVPAGHKIAIRPIPAGAPVIRYGENIGPATRAIEAGEHVHTHNLGLACQQADYCFPEKDLPLPERGPDAPQFLGYPRADGRVGTRNYIAVAAASNCAAHVVELVVRSFESEPLPPTVDGVVAFAHSEGCGQAGGPHVEILRRTLTGVLDHPNVSGAVLIGLGCEVNQIGDYFPAEAWRTERLVGLTIQMNGGTRATVEAARREVRSLIERAAEERRTQQPAWKLVLGLNCGGSDSFSGITANPALGACADRLARLGGTPVLAETTEIFGAEHLLVRRVRNRRVAEKLLGYVEAYKRYLAAFGTTFDDNPSPGNKYGGLSNIVEKSLGAVAKGGTTPLMDAVDYAERIATPGLVFMNTPGYDPVSLAGLAAGGCNVFAFTTGRGSAIGFPTVPVIKIASNSGTFNAMRENMDINAGRIADGEATPDEIGQEIFEFLLRVASGERTAAERFGHREFVPWRTGPVM
ncbi:MAG: altronate dehydratase family protein [Bryobacterales bacterium]|nr:altronate dehydratase family protein [Bryobacteraceae bacterium]MDW8129188.1 altronate dehydratase family protein [Bryobacterales bacterium]